MVTTTVIVVRYTAATASPKLDNAYSESFIQHIGFPQMFHSFETYSAHAQSMDARMTSRTARFGASLSANRTLNRR